MPWSAPKDPLLAAARRNMQKNRKFVRKAGFLFEKRRIRVTKDLVGSASRQNFQKQSAQIQ